jgi:tRNA dimethylallyltransferase
LPPAPSIPPDIRAQARMDVAKDYESYYSVLERADPKSAARIRDPQRLSRALEIWRTTGKIPSEVLDTPPAPPKDLVFNVTAIMPERDQLYARINSRTNIMANLGAVEEATAFLSRDLNPELPAMRAIGVKEFALVKKNEILLQTAIEATSQATRRYAKRQNTWIKQRLEVDFVLNMEENVNYYNNFVTKLYKNLLT